MYNIGVSIGAMAEDGLSDTWCFHALSEAAAGVRYMMYYHLQQLDQVEQQLLRRLFWLLFAGSW